MNHMLLIVIDRGGGVLFIIALGLLVASLVSLPFMPLFHYTQGERLKHFGGMVYGFLGVATMIAGFILIPASLFVVIAGVVVRFRGTGIPQSLIAFALGCAIWLSAPIVFILLGHFQLRFGRKLAPLLWDKKLRTARNRERAKLRRARIAP